jgi:PAS domain S-box-containing protein
VAQDPHISQSRGRNGVASREIFDAIRIPLAVCDPVTGTILSANDAFTRDFGFEIERPGALTLSALGAAHQTPLLSTRLARTLGGAPQAFPWVVRGENGAEHSVELSLTVVQEADTRKVLAQFRPIGGHDHGGTEGDFSDAVINSVPGAFYLIDPDGHMVRWNSITERMSGYTADEIRTMRPDQFFAPEEGDRLRRALRQVFAAGSATVECTLVTKAGRRIPFLLSGRRIMLHGEPFLIGLGVDIRERKQMEDALHQSVARFRSVFEMSPMGMHMYQLDDDGRLIFIGANPAADKILGLKNDQFVGRPIEDAFPPLAETEIPGNYTSVARDGGSWHSDQVLYKDHQIAGAYEVHAFQTSPGQVVAAFIDITDRKRAEAALRESQERLDLAVGGADLGLWDWDIPTGRVTHNARWAEMLGFHPDELEPHFSTWQKLVHPDDKASVLRRLQDHLDGKTSLYEAELRLRAHDGTWRWTLDRGKVVRRDPSGAPIRMSGTQLDITERREAENRLRESLQEKELLLREIHHRVKNNLQVVSSLFNLQAQTITDPKILAALKESHNRVRSMGLVHHVMYQAADFAAVDLVDYVQTLTRSLYRSYAVDPEAVMLSVDIANVRLGIDAAIPCGLIINELVSNALRHAYPEGRRGTLSVTLVHNSDGTHTLAVRDDGVGLPPDLVLPPVATLGLALVETLSRQLEGTLSIERTGGTAISVRFPGHLRA